MREILRRYGYAIFFALLIGAGIRSWVLETFRIPNNMMLPTLHPGEIIIGWKWGFSWPFTENRDGIKRGDIVFFKSDQIYIKRVLGVAGDRLEFKNGLLWRNGKALPFIRDEQLSSQAKGNCGMEDGQYSVCLIPPYMEIRGNPKVITVAEGQLFLVGDLRQRTASNVPFGTFPIDSVFADARRFCFPNFMGSASSSHLGCPIQKISTENTFSTQPN